MKTEILRANFLIFFFREFEHAKQPFGQPLAGSRGDQDFFFKFCALCENMVQFQICSI